MLIVADPGPLATLQDQGRSGLGSVGVTRSGAFDTRAAGLANRLVGNEPSCAVIEALGGGLRLRTDAPTLLAVTGAAGEVLVDGSPVARNAVLQVPRDVEIGLGPPRWGLRSYVAVRGGIAIPPVLGSRSFDSLGRLGPPPLQIGDRLPIGPSLLPHPPVDHAPQSPPAPGPTQMSVSPGPRSDWFTADAWSTLVGATWRVLPTSDRVGVRLSGPPLARDTHRQGHELPPEGLVRGALQVPPDGQPIIMGPDHPTTGGYPVIAVLAPEDISRPSQLVPGDAVRLRAILLPGR